MIERARTDPGRVGGAGGPARRDPFGAAGSGRLRRGGARHAGLGGRNDATRKQDRERFRLQTAILMGRKFKQHIISLIEDGKLARRELDRIKSGKREFF